jgi:very-short-patch-repair endonuclease
MWCWLRNRRFDGHKFRRQHPVGRYIVDFYCPALKLAIELDGRQHAESWMVDYETTRTLALRAEGVEIVRVRNEDFVRDSLMVEERIAAAVKGRT